MQHVALGQCWPNACLLSGKPDSTLPSRIDRVFIQCCQVYRFDGRTTTLSSILHYLPLYCIQAKIYRQTAIPSVQLKLLISNPNIRPNHTTSHRKCTISKHTLKLFFFRQDGKPPSTPSPRGRGARTSSPDLDLIYHRHIIKSGRYAVTRLSLYETLGNVCHMSVFIQDIWECLSHVCPYTKLRMSNLQ